MSYGFTTARLYNSTALQQQLTPRAVKTFGTNNLDAEIKRAKQVQERATVQAYGEDWAENPTEPSKADLKALAKADKAYQNLVAQKRMQELEDAQKEGS